MKKIITAINNPKLNEELKKENKFEIIGKDIQYKEAILELLEKNNKIDLIIINEKIPGEIKSEKLIEKIKLINENIKIIFILEKENKDIEKILIKNNIKDIYYNNKINLNELIEIINKKEINMEEEIIKLKKIIEEKNLIETKSERKRLPSFKNLKDKIENLVKGNFQKIQKKYRREEKVVKERYYMSTPAISFSGNHKSGKSTLSLIISFCLSQKNKKVLLMDADLSKQDLSIILKQKTRQNFSKKKKEDRKNNFYQDRNFQKEKYNNAKKYFFRNKINNRRKSKYRKIKLLKSKYKDKILKNKKNKIYYYQINKILKRNIKKINNNLYFFNEFNSILNNKLLKKEKLVKEILHLLFENLRKNYHYIIIDLAKDNEEIFNKEILKNCYTNFVLLEPNLLGIKESKNLLEKYIYEWRIFEKSLYVVESKKNFISVNKNLISKILPIKNKIFEIKENKFYCILLNHYFKRKILIKNKTVRNDLNKILNKILKNDFYFYKKHIN